MRLRALHVTHFRGAVEGLAGAARGQRERQGLLVRVVGDDGGSGQGEASPLPGYSPDTVDDCAQQLTAVDVARLPLPDGGTMTDWWAQVLAAVDLPAPAARFALETAVLDWWGRRHGISLARLLGGSAAETRRVPLAALASDIPAARAAYRRGVRTFKLKISAVTFEDDLRFAQAMRDEFSTAIRLRFDANRTLPPASAREYLHALARFDPEFVEEPVPLHDFERLTRSPVPLAADESLSQPSAWPRLAAVCRVVVLKPTLLGGLTACLTRARDAAALGLGVTVTHTFDGPVALAAASELAAALPGSPLACGLDRHAGLATWPAAAIAQLGPAHVSSAARPGLGLPDLAPA